MKLNSLFKNKDLIIQLTKREIDIRHKGSKLGHFWSIITPLMMLCLYFFVFGLIFGGHFGILKNENFYDFALALFVGLSLFNVIAETISSGPQLIINQPNFVKKVVFPLEIISISKVLASMYFSLFSIMIAVALIPFSNGFITFKIVYLPLLIIPLFMLSLGVSWSLAAIGVFYRDLNHMTNFIATITMYGSAVVYSPTKLPLSIYTILKYNPLLIIINSVRDVLIWNINISVYDVIYIYISSFILMYCGWYIFKKMRPYFAEVL